MKLARFLSNSIKERLQGKWKDAQVQVFDDSHLHSRGANSHFRVLMVCDEFAGKGPVDRRKEVYKALNEFWGLGVHSISVSTFTAEEFDGKVPGTVGCVNRLGKDN